MANATSAHVSLTFGLRGPNFCTATACAASSHAIGMAFQAIRHGEADAMVAGGTEAAMVPVAIVAFAQMMALSTRYNDHPEQASRPFDRGRDGFVIGEGAGALILEEREAALRRGARIYAELAGFGQSADAFHITAPAEDGGGAALAIRRALASGGIDPAEVGYINAHGTSTPVGDPSETKAIQAALGDHADRVAVSSTKSMTGHLVGAAGAVEGVATVLAVCEGVLPPTINLTDPDPECDLDYVEHRQEDAGRGCPLQRLRVRRAQRDRRLPPARERLRLRPEARRPGGGRQARRRGTGAPLLTRRAARLLRSSGLGSRCRSPFQARFTRCAATSARLGVRAISHHCPTGATIPTSACEYRAPARCRSRAP